MKDGSVCKTLAMSQKIGIWIDKRTARIITTGEGGKVIKTISSNVDESRPGGGSGTRSKGGPQDVVQDSRFMEREKHQLKDYFDEIAANLHDVGSLVIFGPAQTGQKLAKALEEDHKALFSNLHGVEKADSMTDPQLVEWVREYFN
jgi:hypothetical protein